jgi:catechol 2,3-dioxygenase
MGINRIDHAAVLVEDLGRALEWYEGCLGLTVLDRDDDLAHVTCGGDHADVTLVTGGHGLVTFAMGADDLDDLETIERRLDQHGVAHERIVDPDRPGTVALTRFRMSTGHVMEFSVASSERTAGQTDMSWDGVSATPTDIDHINLLGSDAPDDVADFLTDVVGLKISGVLKVEGETAGLWARASTRDHDVAYMRAVRPDDRLHHIAFAMFDSNHYQRLGDRLADNGQRFEFGPGRHGGRIFSNTGWGSNLFAYAFDPSGNRNEFSGDMSVRDDAKTPIVDLPGDQVAGIMNVWANNMPESFMTIGS